MVRYVTAMNVREEDRLCRVNNEVHAKAESPTPWLDKTRDHPTGGAFEKDVGKIFSTVERRPSFEIRRGRQRLY